MLVFWISKWKRWSCVIIKKLAFRMCDCCYSISSLMVVESSRLRIVIRPNPPLKCFAIWSEDRLSCSDVIVAWRRQVRQLPLQQPLVWHLDSTSDQYRSEFVSAKSKNGTITFFICSPHCLCPGCWSQVFGFTLLKFRWLVQKNFCELALYDNSLGIQQ